MAIANGADPDQTAPEPLFAIPLRIVTNNCIKNKIHAQKYGLKCSKF